MFDRLFALETFGIKLGLRNISRLCEALGHPERAFASVHIGGTNGKGSVTAMVHAGLLAAGIPAARYTSPHLTDLTERFVIGNAPATLDEVQEVAEDVLDLADRLVRDGTASAPPTFFEATTAMAFELFRRRKVRAAIIEVGLGGRLDATNVLSPLVSAITSIGLDHQQHLGSTLAAIAEEKAGILKPGTPVVLGTLPPEADGVIVRLAGASGSPVIRSADQITTSTRVEDGRTFLEVRTPANDYGTVPLALRGQHQVGNALVALRIMEVVRERGLPMPFEAIARGLAKAAWPGRLELIDARAGRRLLLDAAHNPDGIAALATYLDRWHPERPRLIFGAMRDKEIGRMLRGLLPSVGTVCVAAPASPRAAAPDELMAAIRAIDPLRDVTAAPDPAHAVDWALAGPGTVCVAGSIFLVGAVRDVLRRRAILP